MITGYQERDQRPLQGKNIFITGGTRDIGGAIVRNLLSEGVAIATTYSRDSSGKTDVPRLLEEVSKTSSTLTFAQANLKTNEGMETVYALLDGQDRDVLILNTSGAGPEINIGANPAILNRYLENRRRRLEAGEELTEGMVVLMQSQPGHYFPHIQGATDIPAFYAEVAPYKYSSEQLIRSRAAEMAEVNTRFFVVCPPEVSNTVNIKVFAKRLDKKSSEKSHFLSRQLGLPEHMLTDEVGEKVVGLLKRSDLPNGYIELFDPSVCDATIALSRWYTPSTMYATTMRFMEEDGKEVGIGYYIANPTLHAASEEPPYMDTLALLNHSMATTTLRVTADHMRGHSWAFPGHKQMRTMIESLAANYRQRYGDRQFELSGYESVSFRQQIQPEMEIQSTSTIMDIAAVDNQHTIDGTADIHANGNPAAEIKGLNLFEILSIPGKDVIRPDQLIEGAAQFVGLSILAKQALGEDIVPLFGGTGKARFYKSVQAGDALLYRISNMRRRKEVFMADVTITRRVEKKGDEEIQIEEERIGNIKKIYGVTKSK